MTYQLKNLNVASLDFSDIRTSLIKFFKDPIPKEWGFLFHRVFIIIWELN